jgi:hypothetical protein
VYEPGGDQGLYCDAGMRVFGEKRIEDAVTDLVTDLVRVTFRDGFGRKQAQTTAHSVAPAGISRLRRVRRAQQIEDPIGHRPFTPGRFANYIAGGIEKDYCVAF